MIKEIVLVALIYSIALVGFMWFYCASLEKQHDEIKKDLQEIKKMVGE